jgi:phospholipase C
MGRGSPNFGRWIACALLVSLASCSGGGAARRDPAQALPPAGLRRAGIAATPIRHVVIVVQENRTFDNVFYGYPGADSATSGLTSSGKPRALRPTSFVGTQLCHVYHCAMIEYAGGAMNGFDKEPFGTVAGVSFKPPSTYAYSYVRRPLVAPYWSMAKQYVLADHLFTTQWGPSFTGHQDLIAGTTAMNAQQSIVDVPTHSPWSCNAPSGTVTSLLDAKRGYLLDRGPFPCFDEYPTLADVMDPAGVSWKYYYPYADDTVSGSIWDAFGAIKKVRYGPDWANVIFVPHQVLIDGLQGTLPAVSWVIPDFLNSDHSSSGSDRGPSWVAAVVNSIGEGPDWNSTAIVVVWDDWGGWYDHVKPPQLDYTGLGFRVPCLVISPYAKAGYVSHTRYEFGSVLRTVEQLFSLPSIGTTDARSKSLLDAFDFARAPRPFTPIPAKYPRSYFITQIPDNLPVDTDE